VVVLSTCLLPLADSALANQPKLKKIFPQTRKGLSH
jgi:hypothetical protein